MNKNIIKKFSAVLLSVAMIMGQAPLKPVISNVYAEEMTTHWAEPYMRNLLDKGIMRSDQFGDLQPDKEMTRAEFVSIINRAFGYTNLGSGKLPFKDVANTDWYADDISIAYHQGYFAGETKNTAAPNGTLTREQAIALICRNLKIEEIPGENLDFKDGREFPTWSRGMINAATKKGFINGYSDNTFRPSNKITRGEAAKLFTDAIGELVDKPGTYTYGSVPGNITITSSGTEIRDTVIHGDLYITEGVGTGYVTLDNVQVLGEVIISGAGEANAGYSSVTFTDSTVPKLTITGPADKVISVKTDGSTSIEKTIVKSDAFLEELTDSRNGGFGDVEMRAAEDSRLNLSGNFGIVTVYGVKNHLELNRGEAQNIIVDEDAIDSTVYVDDDTYVEQMDLDGNAKVSGPGDIGILNINSEDVTYTGLPDEVTIRPGLTASVYGRVMTSKDAEEASSLPKITSNYPKISDIAPTSAEAVFKTNKPGDIYWAITLADDDSVSKKDLLKPKNVKGIIKSGTISAKNSSDEYTVKLSGLTSDKKYTVTAMLVDEREEESSKKTKSFTTQDNIAPNFVSGYPKVNTVYSVTADISVVTTKDCKLYWALFPQGSVAPTALELTKQKLDGEIAKGSEKNVKKNVESLIHVDKMEEAVTYDFYVIATDGENDSKVTKLSITTLDKTPPVFAGGYPRMDKITDKSIDIKYNLNEDGTIYYVVCKNGTIYPTPIPPATIPPVLSSEEAKQAVITGNNAFKSGSAAVKANNEGVLKISGLEAQTTYEVYLVAIDKAKNATDVVKLKVRTMDIIPPTVKQEFEDTVNDEPTVDSEIRIVFSEEVWDATTLKNLTREGLSENITLYDLSADKRTAIELDFSKAIIDNENDVTTVILGKEATKLKSGNKYQFEINNIVDTSQNKMSNKTLLPEFKTLAPLVELIKTVSDEDKDMSFQLNPQSTNTADNVLFDIIFETDTTVEFRLFKREEGETVFTEISNMNYRPFVMENEAITLHYIIDRKLNGQKDYSFERFKDLGKTEFAIQLTAVDGNTERESWSKTIKINVKCVIGSKTNLSMIAGDPIHQLEQAVKEGASVVNYPTEFQLMASFTDTVIPQFMEGYPKLDKNNEEAGEFSQIGDVAILPLVRTTKKAMMYYLIAPRGVVDNPNPLDIMAGVLKPQGGVSGSFEVPSANIEFEVPIQGLTPKTKYTMFAFLKGTPPETGEMWVKNFETTEMNPPIIDNPEPTVTNKGENFAEVTIVADKDCTLDWIVFPSLSAPSLTDPTDPAEIARFAEIIRNGKETLAEVLTAYGAVDMSVKRGDDQATASITIKGLSRNIYYTFFAVAKSPLGGGDSHIAVLEGITPKDVTPPGITVTTIISNPSRAGRPYNGFINIVFSEPVYYIPGENLKPVPLTAELFNEGLEKHIGDGDASVEGVITTRVESSTYARLEDGSKEKALTSVSIRFTGVLQGSVIEYKYNICDKSENVAGKLYMEFYDNDIAGTGEGRAGSRWNVSFMKEQN